MDIFRITEISPYKGSTVCIIFDYDRRIYVNQKMAEGLKCGDVLSSEEVERLTYENDVRKARERALYLLEGRDHSFDELYKKLKRTYPESIALEVCNKMEELGLIDDRRYAEKLCSQLYEIKKLGRYRVKQEMRLKGLDDDIIEEAMENYAENDEDGLERLEELVEQKYERYLTDEKGVTKVKNALIRKGYSYSDIKAVLDLYDLDFQ